MCTPLWVVASSTCTCPPIPSILAVFSFSKSVKLSVIAARRSFKVTFFIHTTFLTTTNVYGFFFRDQLSACSNSNYSKRSRVWWRHCFVEITRFLALEMAQSGGRRVSLFPDGILRHDLLNWTAYTSQWGLNPFAKGKRSLIAVNQSAARLVKRHLPHVSMA